MDTTKKFHSVNGGAENTTLTNDSVDYIGCVK